MPREVPILVQNEHDRPDPWQRFAAIFCLMGFYTLFVVNGHAFYTTGIDTEYRFGSSLESFWVYLIAMLAALMLYPAGRALWFGRRSARYWLTAAIGLMCVGTAVECIVNVRSGYLYYYGILNRFAWNTPAPEWLGVLRVLTENLNWLLVFIAIVWFAWRTPRCSRRVQSTWTIIAIVWCAAHGTRSLFSGEISALIGYSLQEQGLGVPAVAAYLLVLVLLTVLLWRGSGLARTFALAIAAAALVAALENWFIQFWLVNVAIRALYIAHSDLPLDEINRWVWTENDALGLLVHPVRLVGPWLLIAFYAWRVPMRMAPDDGTPFPRRFCGNCHYNLHGIESERCPECGCVLVDPGTK
jgi:hypothetical protein